MEVVELAEALITFLPVLYLLFKATLTTLSTAVFGRLPDSYNLEARTLWRPRIVREVGIIMFSLLSFGVSPILVAEFVSDSIKF